jgi:hypothetical protein
LYKYDLKSGYHHLDIHDKFKTRQYFTNGRKVLVKTYGAEVKPKGKTENT